MSDVLYEVGVLDKALGGDSVVMMYILTLYGVIISGSDWNAIQIAYIYRNYRFSVNSGNGSEGL